jgi:Fe-S-cluster formation regulator IscX/YfhJ
MKFRAVGAELFHTDERTDGQTDRQADMTKLIVALHNIVNEPKNRPTVVSEFC